MPMDHEPHPHCPDNLDCLPDTNGKPQHTLPVILRCAILGSPGKQLTIREIYATMEKKYSYYRTAGPTWKQSVRHHLSLNRLFERKPRPVTDPGFGSYWTVNLSAPPGTKRPRKRGRRNKILNEEAHFKMVYIDNQPSKDLSEPIKPRLPPISSFDFPPRRPCGISPLRASDSHDGHEEDELLSGDDSRSDETYESEDDTPCPPSQLLMPRRPFVNDNSFAISPLVPASFGINENTGVLGQLQRDVDALRCKLADAHADAALAREAQRSAEKRLNDEQRKRIEAERVAQEELRLRHVAEGRFPRTRVIRGPSVSP